MKANCYVRSLAKIIISVVVVSPLLVSQSTLAGLPAGPAPEAVQPTERWRVENLDTQDAGTNVSLALDPDHDQTPWLSYYNAGLGRVEVAHYVGTGGSCGPNYSWYCQVFAPPYYFESDTSIDIFPDVDPDPLHSTWKVGVVYGNPAWDTVLYAEYTCTAIRICDWTFQEVWRDLYYDTEIGSLSFKYSPSGIPTVAFYRHTNFGSGIIYAWYVGDGSGQTCIGSIDWECGVADISDSEGLGLYLSLDMDFFGIPHIAYYDGINHTLKYAIRTGIGTCGSTNYPWSCYLIDNSSANTGLFPSIKAPQESGEVPLIAYYDSTNGKLRYAYKRNDNNGNCAQGNSWQCMNIDTIGSGLTQVGISLAVNSSNTPMIAYMDSHDPLAPSTLEVAQPAFGHSYGNCGGLGFNSWWCRRVDIGGAYQQEADYVSLGVKPNGLAVIAYSELDTYAYPVEHHLKIAYQEMMIFLPIVRK